MSINGFSQENSKPEYFSFEKIIGDLEQKYNVRFFYKAELFQNINFHESILELSLEDAIRQIQERTNCQTIIIDNLITLLPPSKYEGITKSSNSKVVKIGSSRELGKSSKALLTGRIVDGKSGTPLIGAILYDENLKVGTSTNLNGEFSFQLPVGDHKLKISYIGYEDAYQTVQIYSSGAVDFEIFEKSVSLDGVYVYSERPEMNITRTQMSIEKLNSKGIKELPVSIGEVDVIKSLTLLPGVQSVGEFGTGFNVRGGGADQNLILIEDVPLFNSSHLFGLTSVINSDAVNNVTLIKAGIPAKYGERVSSVMSIKMNQAAGEGVSMKVGVGLLNCKALLEVPLWNNKVGLSIGGRSSYSNWILKKMPDVDLMNSKTKFYDINGLLSININTNNKISVFGYNSFDYFDYNTRINYSYSNTIGSVKWYHAITKDLSFNLIAGFSNYNYQVCEKDSSKLFEASKIYSSLEYKMFKANFLFTPSKTHTIEFGGNAFHYSIYPGRIEPYGDASSIIPLRLNSENAVETGLFISDNISINSNLGVDIGLRYSSFMLIGPGRELVYKEGVPRIDENIVDTLTFSKNKNIKMYSGFEPRINFKYIIDESKSIKLSYSRINQYINLVSVTSSITPSDIWKLSNRYIKPLKCDQYSLGYFNNFLGNSLETSVEFFYKKLENALEYKNGAEVVMNPNIESGLINADGYNMGMEVYIKKNSGKLGGWISYTLSRSMRRTNGKWDDEIINDNKYFPSSYDKTHNLVVNGNYYISQRWRFAATFTYNTGRPVTIPEYEYYLNGYKYIYYSDRNEYRLPDYHRLDVSITLGESLRIKKKWKGSFTFSVINVYGRKNAYSLYYQRNNSVFDNSYNLYKLYIIGRPFPTLTYNIVF
ncbi:TonB-dependent receptor [Tenuifilaceae bacterium CYCD]|nr:TonB-dependent receptor [Tenuifilaceae bacterium CYCD]